MTNQVSTIQKLVIRTFILTTAATMLFTILGAIYFNYQSTEIIRRNSIQKIHETLIHLMTPSLDITDTTEIRHLLSMASSNDEVFMVINTNHDILLADYSTLSLANAVIESSDTINCQNLSNTKKNINGRGYWIHCTPIYTSDILNPNQRIGTLISLSHTPWISISPMIIYFLSGLIIAFILTITTMRYILKRNILIPLLDLNKYIVFKSKSPLMCDYENCQSNTAPYEILAIRNAFEKVVGELQYEYQMRVDATKKQALLDQAAQVAHDIRSTLAIMEICVSKISENTSNNEIIILKNAIQSLRKIASNLLVRYRDQGSCTHNVIDAQSIPLTDILQSVIDMKKHEWQDNPCDLTLEIDSDVSTCLTETSATAFSRLLSNLLNNAYESLQNKRKILARVAAYNNQTRLTITDTGRGIPVDKIADALNGVSLKKGGTGLGLSSAKRYIEGLGGELRLSSICEEGTEVTLIF